MATRLVLLLATLPLAALTGCLGGDDAPETAAIEDPTSNRTAQNATLPEGRGESAGLKETNITEEGVGGVEHKHDHWGGKESLVIFEEDISISPLPIFPDGQGTNPKASAYLKMRNGTEHMVLEGTTSVTMLAGTPYTQWGDTRLDHPAPPKLYMEFRSAADSEWRDAQELTYGTALEIPVTPQMTDMPHSVSSLWVFRFTTDRSDAMSVPLTITIHKGAAVLDWPGHPDFYATTSRRVVLDEHVTTHMNGLESLLLYDGGGTWVHPEKLISWGTTKLEVYLNITKITNAYNAQATGYFLEAHNATIIGPEITFGSRYFDPDEPADLVSWNFTVPVDDGGMDGPYQPESRWGFRAMASFAEIGLCPGCFPYDIEYDIQVVAVHEPKPEDEASA